MMKHLIVTIILICSFFDNYGQLACQDFTITGTTITASYPPSQGSSCTIAPTPIGSILWTGASATGSITYTFVTPQTNVSMWYTAVNTDDYGTISVNGGGVLSLSMLNGCANLSGNVVGPYTGDGSYGDIQVNVTSSLPFTTITLVNTGDNSGFNSGDCSSVSFSNIPVCDIQLGNDTTLCLGDALTLNATANNATYLWQDNSTNPTFNVSQQGTYWVQVTQDNCITSDTINVNFNPLPTVNVGNDTTLCQGDALTLNATTNNATYLWQNNTTSPTFNVSQQGTYWVQVTQNNCTSSDTINVNFNPLPTVNVGIDTTLCLRDTITLDAATNNATYLWQDNSTSSTFNVSQQGTYWVQATQNNCSLTDTILITEEECELILEIPNVFTPNNDGLNDVLVPKSNFGVISMNTTIYNRWGNTIYETDNLFIEWDGQFATDGTYFWVVDYSGLNGNRLSKKGQLTLLR
jgi:gliding motility-associated-like protein